MGQNELEELRGRIDETDRKIIALLNERFSLAKSIYDKKLKSAVTDRRREEEVLKKAAETSDCVFSDSVRAVYEEIIRQSKKVQR